MLVTFYLNLTPGSVYLFTSNGPILKSAKRRKTLSPGPEKKHKILCFSIKDVTLIIIIMD